MITLRSDNNGLMELRCYSQCWGRLMFWPGGCWVAVVSPRHIHRHTRECIVPYNNHSTTTVRGTSNRRTQLSSGILVGLLFIIPPRSEFLEEDLHSERSELHRCRSNEWPECGSATALLLNHPSFRKVRVKLRHEHAMEIVSDLYTAASEKTWILWAVDWSDGDLKQEQLELKFVTFEIVD